MVLCRTSVFKNLFLVVATLAIAACGGSGGGSSAAIESDADRSNAPVISQILTDIRFIPQEYGGITTTPFQSIEFFVEADVIDPQGLGDIDFIGQHGEIILAISSVAKQYDTNNLVIVE